MLVLPHAEPRNLQKWALPYMAKLNVFALLNAFTGSFVSFVDSIPFVIRLISFSVRFDLSGIFVYLLSLRSEAGGGVRQTRLTIVCR